LIVRAPGWALNYSLSYKRAKKQFKRQLIEQGVPKGDAEELLESRWFFYSAGEYNKAGELVQNLTEPLHRWGFINLVRGLNEETVESATGVVKAAALHHLGIIHYAQGRYEEAVKLYQDSLKIKEELGDKSGIAITLGQMGRIFHAQENYKEALRCYLHAFVLFDELNSPYKDLAKRDISELKEGIGDALFDRYYEELTTNE